MPIIQDYNINTGDAYEGMVYGLRTAMTIRTVEAEAEHILAGRAVSAKAGTVRGVQPVASSTANDTCYGIIVRQVNHEAATRPSNGVMQINEGDLLGMLVEGEIMVKLGASVKRDQVMGVDANGLWTSSNAYANVVALKGGVAGDIIPARIFTMTPKPAVTK